MWFVIIAMFVICLLIFGAVWLWDRVTPLARHPMYESVQWPVESDKTADIERRSSE